MEKSLENSVKTSTSYIVLPALVFLLILIVCLLVLLQVKNGNALRVPANSNCDPPVAVQVQLCCGGVFVKLTENALSRAKRGAFLMEQGGGERAKRIEWNNVSLV